VQEDDPEKRSGSQLSDATGVPPTAIYGDVEGFEKQNKPHSVPLSSATTSIIATYILSHPMAARVSHDILASSTLLPCGHPASSKSFLERIHNAMNLAVRPLPREARHIAFPDIPSPT